MAITSRCSSGARTRVWARVRVIHFGMEGRVSACCRLAHPSAPFPCLHHPPPRPHAPTHRPHTLRASRTWAGAPSDRFVLSGNYEPHQSYPPCVTSCSDYLNSQDDMACPRFDYGVAGMDGEHRRAVYGSCWAGGEDSSARLEVVPSKS